MLERSLKHVIEDLSASFPVLLLTGPRQIGKTTLLESCADETRSYISLDDLEERAIAKNDPNLFLQIHKPPLIIDEIQYAPELLSYIKIHVDKNHKPGDFWLTGSQRFHLMKGITESLAGRVAVIDMLGLSSAEISGHAHASAPFVPSLDWINAANPSYSSDLDSVFQKIWLGIGRYDKDRIVSSITVVHMSCLDVETSHKHRHEHPRFVGFTETIVDTA